MTADVKSSESSHTGVGHHDHKDKKKINYSQCGGEKKNKAKPFQVMSMLCKV